MYERFTDHARSVMRLASEVAIRRRHEYVGTEHILLALLENGAGVGASILKQFAVDIDGISASVDALVANGKREISGKSRLPQTPRAKRVIEQAMAEAQNLGHNYVGTEHLLLGLLHIDDGVAAQTLKQLNVDAVRELVLEELDTPEFHARNEQLGHGPYRPAFSITALMGRLFLGRQDDSPQ